MHCCPKSQPRKQTFLVEIVNMFQIHIIEEVSLGVKKYLLLLNRKIYFLLQIDPCLGLRQLALRLQNKSVISHLWQKIAHTPWHILNTK